MGPTEPPAKETQHDTKPRKKKWHENWVVNRAYDWGTGKNGQPMRYRSKDD